jgi:hypothetical protein
MLESAEVFMLRSRVAREERVAAAGGLPLRWVLLELEVCAVGGRCETQSCTSRETRGLERRLRVFRERALVVIIITGPCRVGAVEGTVGGL